jgi:RNA polymerase sigma-70 factor, ECF subfamily
MTDKISDGSLEPTDEWLMKKFAEGIDEHFATLYQRYGGRVYAYLKRKIRDQSIADEVFQEVFLKLVKSRHSFKADGHFAPWLFSIVRRSMIDELRREERQGNLASHANTMSTSENETEEKGDIESILSSLNDKDRLVLLLRYVDDLPFEAIASKTGFSLSNVRKIASRAICKLRQRGI